MISRAPASPYARAARVALRLLPAALLLSAGCATREQSSDGFLGLITPYRIDIVQGTAVTKEQAALVKLGMTRNQVRDLLGSPMLTDMFHNDRWDYVFTIRRPGAAAQRRSIVAHFEGDSLKKIDLPEALPSENEFVAALVPLRGVATARSLELSEEQRKGLPAPKKVDAAAAAAPLGAARSYPPLERPQ
jgi:outer membrane protein assembly factor BamE